jgi:hypothetical protein
VVEQVRVVCALLQYVAPVAASIFLGLFAYGDALAGPPDYVAELQLAATPGGFAAGQVHQVIVKVANHGKQPWPSLSDDPSHPVRLSYHWIDGDGKMVITDGVRTELPRTVRPGEGLLVRASILSPDAPGTYTLIIDVLREEITWFAAQGSSPLTISPIEVHRVGWLTWQRGRILLIAVGTLCLFYLMGFGVAELLCCNAPRAVTAVVGVAAIVALSYYASLLGVSMQRATWAILALGIGLAILTLTRRRRFSRPRQQGGGFGMALTVAMSLLTLFPLWEFGRPSAVRNTYASYFVIMSEYWKAHTLYEVPRIDPYQPLDYLVRERLLQGYMDGTPFLNAFVASTFDLNSYETYSILTALLLALFPTTLCWVARSAFGLGPWASSLAALLALCNVTYLLWSLQGQLPFVAGILFLPVALGTGAALLEGRGSLWLAALCSSTLLAVYPPLAAYALVPLLCYGGFQVWQKALSLKTLGLTFLKLLGLLALLNPVILSVLTVSGFRLAAQVSENWHNIPSYPSIAELLGLFPHFSFERVGGHLKWLAWALILAVASVTGYGVQQLWKQGRYVLITTILPYILGALVIVFVMDYAYGYYKHGVVTLFAFLCAFSNGLVALWHTGGTWGRLVPALCLGTFLALNLLAVQALLVVTPPTFVHLETASLSAVKRLNSAQELIFIDERDVATQLWMSYFLWGARLSVPPAFEPWGWWGFSSVFGRGDPNRFYHPTAALALTQWGEITRPRPEPIWSNALYTLHPDPSRLILGQGWYDLEDGPAPARWMAGEGTLQLNAEGLHGRSVRLKMVLVPIAAPLSFEVSLRGKPVDTFTAQDVSRPAVFLTPRFAMEADATLTIRSLEGCSEPTRLFGGSDGRCLSARFQEIGLIEVGE